MAALIAHCSRKGESCWAGDTKALEKGDTVESGLSITGNQAAQSRDKVIAWAKEME